MKIGSTDIVDCKIGSTQVNKVYLGSNLVWEKSLPLLLDLYPDAAAAYSLRKLRTAYAGPAIRVRRSSEDFDEIDIGFVDNELDTASLLSFANGGDVFISTWYDQSGLGNDVTQTTAANQPKIVSSGSLIVENGKPYLSFSANQYLNMTSKVFNADVANAWIFYVSKPKEGAGRKYISNGQGSPSLFADRGYLPTYNADNKVEIVTGRVGGYSLVEGSLISSQSLITTNADRINLKTWLNGTIDTNITDINTDFSEVNFQFIGGGNIRNSNVDLQELIFYNTDKTDNRASIESNINSHYNIY